MKRSFFLVPVCVVLIGLTLPYVLAALMAGSNFQFIGFLFNPIDSASYLAKMRQGWDGSWRFILPYTAEAHDGAFIFLYYLFLGHLARWINIPVIWMFHLARLAGAGLLLFALGSFCMRIFRDQPDQIRLAYWWCVAGSGMGWLVIFFGPLPTDFWVAEAYPFLSMFSNPHFPLGLALVVLAFDKLLIGDRPRQCLELVLLGILISIIFQFGLVLVLAVAVIRSAWRWVETRRLEWRPVFCLGFLGGLFLLYQYFSILSDPVLAGWNIQNQTPGPQAWDFMLSFSPALPFAIWGGIGLVRQKNHPARSLLVSWLVAGLLLISIPFMLQRRFILGYHIPVALLAVFGITDIVHRWPGWRRLPGFVLSLALPTNLLLILIGLAGAVNHSPMLYLTQDEARGLAWIEAKTEQQAIILASPEMGRLIPAFTGRRVLYGHPFETVNASQMEAEVSGFFKDGNGLSKSYLSEHGVDFIFYGPREQALGGSLSLESLVLAFQSGQVRIYSVADTP